MTEAERQEFETYLRELRENGTLVETIAEGLKAALESDDPRERHDAKQFAITCVLRYLPADELKDA
jgi:hypothetical protein